MSVSPIPRKLGRRWSPADDCGTHCVAVTAASHGGDQHGVTALMPDLPASEVAQPLMQRPPTNTPYLVELATEYILQPGYDFGNEFEFGLGG